MGRVTSWGDGSSERVRTAAVAGARVWQERVQQAAITVPQRVFDHRNVSAMALLRQRRPVLAVGSVVVVTRREDVLAVLSDADTFPPPYADGLAAGFVLGQRGDDLRRHRAALTSVLRSGDLGALQQRATDLARSSVADADPAGMAVGRELVRPVLLGVVAGYVGITGPRPDRLMHWSREIFQDIFLNNAELPLIRARGDRATRELAALVRVAVDERRRTPAAERRDDLVTRLLALVRTPEQVRRDGEGLTEDEVVDTVIGLAIGWLWHGAKALMLALDGLLDRREALVPATAAARAGDLEQLRRILWEVLRFRPVQVGLPRTCAHGAVLAEGTPYETDVPPGAFVLAGTHAAMWDERVVPDPTRFDPTRAEGQYVVFGHGPHRCLGEDLMRGQLPAILAPLLEVSGLGRAGGRHGRLSWVGPSPDDLWVEFFR